MLTDTKKAIVNMAWQVGLGGQQGVCGWLARITLGSPEWWRCFGSERGGHLRGNGIKSWEDWTYEGPHSEGHVLDF